MSLPDLHHFKQKYKSPMDNFFTNMRVLVLGDVMLDRYWWGDVQRISPEAPVPIVQVEQNEDRLGGAANVAHNISQLGAQTHFITALGDDATAQSIASLCEQAKIHLHAHYITDHPSTLKLRILGQRQQMLRVDFEQSLPEDAAEYLLHLLTYKIQDADICIASDYGKGALQNIQAMIRLAKTQKKKMLIDPKGDDFSMYRGAFMLTPNKKEFEQIVGKCPDEATFIERAQQLRTQLNLNALLVTRSAQGMSLFSQDGHQHYTAQAREVFDVSGAGDTVIAVLGACLAAHMVLQDAVYLANLAAGLVVAKSGTSTVSWHELKPYIQKHFTNEPIELPS